MNFMRLKLCVIVAVVDIPKNINFYNWRITQLHLLITIITLH